MANGPGIGAVKPGGLLSQHMAGLNCILIGLHGSNPLDGRCTPLEYLMLIARVHDRIPIIHGADASQQAAKVRST